VTEAVVALWRDTARASSGRDDIELAAPFQRHYLKRGTGLPPNFCLALTAADALFFKFDPRHGAHPVAVNARQIKKLKLALPRSALRVVHVDRGRLAIGVHFEMQQGARPPVALQCRTPRYGGNPAAVAMIDALGGRVEAIA
jgi:hypothetical protein